MKHLRVMFLLFFAFIGCSPTAYAKYPNKMIRLIVPYSAGGTTDAMARIVATELSSRLGQQVIVDNKPGGGTMLASQHVASAAPDGYTFLVNGSSLPVYVSVYSRADLEPLKRLEPVNMMVVAPHILVVHPSVPANNLKAFIAYAKTHPDIMYGTVGMGSIMHLEGELFNSLAGTRLVPVAYKGSAPALLDLLPGRVQVMFDNISSSMPYIKSGELKVLGVTTASRSIALPDVPTLAEAGLPGYEAVPWLGLLAPAGTPKADIELISNEVSAILAEPKIREKLLGMGLEVIADGPEEFGKFYDNEFSKWSEIARKANIQLD